MALFAGEGFRLVGRLRGVPSVTPPEQMGLAQGGPAAEPGWAPRLGSGLLLGLLLPAVLPPWRLWLWRANWKGSGTNRRRRRRRPPSLLTTTAGPAPGGSRASGW
jgi:hypothetical protein